MRPADARFEAMSLRLQPIRHSTEALASPEPSQSTLLARVAHLPYAGWCTRPSAPAALRLTHLVQLVALSPAVTGVPQHTASPSGLEWLAGHLPASHRPRRRRVRDRRGAARCPPPLCAPRRHPTPHVTPAHHQPLTRSPPGPSAASSSSPPHSTSSRRCTSPRFGASTTSCSSSATRAPQSTPGIRCS